MIEDRINALKTALLNTPENDPLRLLLAEVLQQSGRDLEALEQYEMLFASGGVPGPSLVGMAELALRLDRIELASRCVEQARHAGLVEGVARVQNELDRKLQSQGVPRLPRKKNPGAPEASQSRGESAPVTFSDVGGLDAVKRAIHRTIILPMQRPELYQKYGRHAGGGVMLYGPPGCGKTFLARATAGECGLPFHNLRIENILDPWFGVSERNLHQSFQQAREDTPCVLFIDELDALAYARNRQHGNAGRMLVDQLLQELDAIGSDNGDMLILSATNAPWDVDDALKRPGRFDRVLFIPPPDLKARECILALLLAGKPWKDLNLADLAGRTPLFSGADLKALVDLTVDSVIEEALKCGLEIPLTMAHFTTALSAMRPTTLDWLSRAKNHVEFSSQNDRYREVEDFLNSCEAGMKRKFP